MDIRRVFPSDDDGLAHSLSDLQRAAYAVEAVLIGDDRIPPLREELMDLRRAPVHWLAAVTGPDLAGAIAWSEDERKVEVERLVLAPYTHRRGVGIALMRAVMHHAGARPTVVATGRDNIPARSLYERLGFTAYADEEVLPGLRITQYTHNP